MASGRLKEQSSRLRIVVTGLAATYPLGGVFWDYLQYVVGFLSLGHDVLYLEDSGKWCYDPEAQTFVENGARNAAYFAREIVKFDSRADPAWYFRDAAGNDYGRSLAAAAEFCRTADLLVDVSASCRMCDEYLKASRIAFIDSDPMYTQACVSACMGGGASPEDRASFEKLRLHDVFFTFGENVGAPECLIPSGPFAWIPTRQPIALSFFDTPAVRRPVSARRHMLTTVMSWEPAEKGPTIDGVAYRGKSAEFERFAALPEMAAAPLELAISGKAPLERLRELQWRIRDAYEISRDPWVYRDYLANSLGEWSVAKNAYVRSRSGWFSCRSACYLALGVPTIVQDTGFDCALPQGEGILAFSTVDEARAAITAVAGDPERHARAALEIAHEHFDARRVLARLIDRAA